MTGLTEKKFRQSFKVAKELLQWYPGHMEKGMTNMQRILKNMDCVLEVHDARIAVSGRNPNFVKNLLGVKPHILVLNKVDLIEKSDIQIIKSKCKQDGIENVIFTNCLQYQTCDGIKKLVPKAIDLIMKAPRYNRIEESDLCMMVIGIPNVGKSSVINALRKRNLNRGNATQVGAVAGITKSVLTKIKVNVCPSMFLIDTPGILPPKISNNETGLKLALCACLKDSIVGDYIMADFLLYWLNKSSNFTYVNELDLDEPTDDIITVLKKIALDHNMFMKRKDIRNNSFVKMVDINKAASYMIKQFRSGTYGLINLDKNLLTQQSNVI